MNSRHMCLIKSGLTLPLVTYIYIERYDAIEKVSSDRDRTT